MLRTAHTVRGLISFRAKLLLTVEQELSSPFRDLVAFPAASSVFQEKVALLIPSQVSQAVILRLSVEPEHRWQKALVLLEEAA